MARHRIAVFNTNDTRRDPRVRRIAGSLAAQGHEVRVFEMAQSGLSAEEEIAPGITARRVPFSRFYSHAAMQELERASPEFGALIRATDPEVMDEPGPTRLRWLAGGVKRRLRAQLQRVFPRLPAPEPAWRRRNAEIAPIRSIMLVNLALFQAAQEFRPTLAWCNDLDTLPAGHLLKARLGIPLAFDAHEIYPEQFPEHMRSDRWHRFYTRLEAELAPRTDLRLTVCDAIADYFATHYGAPGFVTVRNVPSLRLQPGEEVLSRRPDARRRILYHGAYFAYRGLDEIIRAARLVQGAEFVFRGFGPHEGELRRLAESEGVQDRVTFAAPVAVDELVPSASQCDIGLNPFVNVCLNTEFALPNKFFEYMMAGLALASSDLVEMRNLTRELRVGETFAGLEPEAIAATLNGMLARPEELDACRRRAWQAARDRFNWEAEQERLLGAVARLG